MKKKILISVISIILICFIVFSVVFDKDKVLITDIKSPKSENVEQNYNITKEQIELINACYIYVEKYCSNDISTDTKELNNIVNDINSILSKDLFFYGFSASKYQDRLDTDKSYFKNGGVFGESFLKHFYYKELLVVKLKALLLLGEFDEFQNVFIEHYNLILITKDSFPVLISMDKNISKDSEIVGEILKCYDKILSMNLNERDVYYVTTDAISMFHFGDFGEKKSKEYSSLREKLLYEPNEFFYGLNCKELNKDNVCLYSYEVEV